MLPDVWPAAAGPAESCTRSEAMRLAAFSRSRSGVPLCRVRPEIVQPASVASGRTVPAARRSVIRQASLRSRSTSSMAASTTSTSNDSGTAVACTTAASQGASTSSIVLPPRRTSTTASPPISRTAPRSPGLTSRLASPRSITTRGTATSGRPAGSRSTTSRYSIVPHHRHAAARLVTRPSIPAKIASSGRSRRSVSTITAGANQTAAASTASAASAKTPRLRRGRGCHSSSDRERRVAIDSEV